MIVIKEVTVVSSQGQQVQDVYIREGKIVGPFDHSDLKVVDGRALHLIPGVIDAHVHFRTPGATHKEDWETASRAALRGGVTTVLDMPNNDPAILSQAALDAKKALIEGKSHVHYGFHFGATGNFEAMEQVQGIKGFKVYMGSSTGDLLADEPSVWERIFEIAKQRDLPVIVHAENEERIRSRSKAFAQKGEDSVLAHPEIRDCECAKIATEAAVQLREKVGNRLHIAHMSCKEELDILRLHKNPLLSCEVAPHHLFFKASDMKDGFLKMNPPLRHQEDVEALWEGLQDGSVNCLATDHAPHTIEEKQLANPPSGVPGVQFLLPLMLDVVNEGRLSLERLVYLLCEEPARIFSLSEKGFIEEGMDADLVLLDLEAVKSVSKDLLETKCGWSPYEGKSLKGWPVSVFVSGEIALEDGQILPKYLGHQV